MTFMTFSSAVAATVSTAFGCYALLMGDMEISIVSLSVALLMVGMARPASQGPTMEASSDVKPDALPKDESSSATPRSKKSIPVLTIDAYEDDEDEAVFATLTGLEGPIFVAMNENDGPVHTLVVPNTPTRLLWSDDLRDCA